MNFRHLRSYSKSAAFIVLVSSAVLLTVNFSARQLAAQEAQEHDTTTEDATATTLAPPTLSWSPKGDPFGSGRESFVAMNASGFIVEVHTSPNGTGLYYHLGKLDMQNGIVQWGPSRRFASAGTWPTVAIDKSGLVVITRSDAANNCCSNLDYWVGTLDVNGDVQQEIYFRSSQIEYDRGFHNGLSMNNRDILVETHESGNGGKGIYYRLGVVTTNYEILWFSGTNGQRYDDGVDTRVALNLQGDVVEVHRVRNEGILHYTRGTINTNQGKIYFNDKPRLDNEGLGHSVALRDDSYLVETESSSGNLFYRTGMLNTTDLARVDWTDRARMFPRISTEKDRSSVAVNATWAVVTFEADNKLYCTTARVP